jgi:hypothetical protein
MREGNVEREQRPVLIYTVRGTLEGELQVGAALRTLDRLNLSHQAFVTIENPGVLSGGWSMEHGALVLNTSSILFVVERSNPTRGGSVSGGSARFSRSAVRLQVGEFEALGFLHVPGNGRALARLQQDRHAFLALTSASVTGPDTAFVSSFVAVNRARVLAAQELGPDADFERVACAAGDSELA